MRLLRHMALFPLLRKDLTELAQRRRTYVLRVLYAVLLFVCFLLAFKAALSNAGSGPTSVLGSGRDVFDFLLTAQFVGIYVFLPAMMSGVVTYEKERRSLELLFLTDLRPWEILLEKYLGRLVPMFAFLLLALPLLAVAYAYGGVPTGLLWASVYMLALTCLQVGALALMCSAFFTSGAAAFLATYVIGAVLYVITPLCPPYVLFDSYSGGMGEVVSSSIPVLVSIVCFLAMARQFLVGRAFARPGHLLQRIFRRMDVFWNKANRLTGGIVLLKESNEPPEDRPVLWREVKTKSLARFSHLFRILVAVELPVLLVAAACLMDAGRGDTKVLSVLLLVMWPVAALALAVVAGNTFASERVGQTLDVLLTTPLSGAEIVRQKVRALRRFMLVLAAPLVTLYAAEALVQPWGVGITVPRYLAATLLSIIVYFPMIVWVSVWIGMRQRSRVGAAIVPVVVLFLWCALPPFVLDMLQALVGLSPDWVDQAPLLLLTTPMAMVLLPELSGVLSVLYGPVNGLSGPLLDLPAHAIVLNYVFYGAVALFFRRLCLRNADRYLGRVPSLEGEEADVAQQA